MSRQTLITFQPAPVVDGHAPDGTELTRLPYPVHAWASDGAVPKDLGGYNEPRRIVGMTDKAGRESGNLVLPWTSVARDPHRSIGLYLVTENDDGSMTLLTSAVDTVEVREFERPDTIDPITAPIDSARRREGWQR